MKNLLLSKPSMLVTDVLLVITFIGVLFVSEAPRLEEFYWATSHCIAGSVMILLMALHLWQHWNFIKALLKKKFVLKNKLTALSAVIFVLTTLSVLVFIQPDFHFIKLHHLAGHLFMITIIIHLIDKWKQLITLFKKSSNLQK